MVFRVVDLVFLLVFEDVWPRHDEKSLGRVVNDMADRG